MAVYVRPQIGYVRSRTDMSGSGADMFDHQKLRAVEK
jgi:hypothetical protein